VTDPDEIDALANRLRVSGWTAPPPAFTPEEHRHVQHLRRLGHKPKRPSRDRGFGILDSKVREAGMWLAANPDAAGYLPRSFIADKFHLSFDDAVRAVAEAERLLGVTI
jgi:hypothetical protein